MMNELCFKLDGDNLYMEQVLIDYNENPVFYVCKGKDSRYLVLCIDIEEPTYCITRVSVLVLSSMINGDISMRDGFMRGTQFWKVQTGEDPERDTVISIKSEEINVEDLPKEGGCFKAYSSELIAYRNKLQQAATNEMRLLRLSFQTIEFKRIGKKNGNDIVLSIVSEIMSADQQDLMVNVTMNGKKEGDFTTKLELTGVFALSDIYLIKNPTRETDDIIKSAAVSMMMPYLRSELNMITAQSEVGSDLLGAM